MVGIRAREIPDKLTPGTVRCVLMAGVAGALDPSLRIGDLVLDAAKGSSKILPAISTDPVLRSMIRGKIHTAGHLVATPAEKADRFHRTHAHAVDMELSIVREVLSPCGIPVLGLRAISDTAAESVDPKLLDLIDAHGHPKPAALAKAILFRPRLAVELIRLGRHSHEAIGRLGEATRRLLAAGAD